jgi:hypothetical protein
MISTNNGPGWSAWINSGFKYASTALTDTWKKTQEQHEIKCKEAAKKALVHQWGLDFDPMYGMVRLGIVGLMDENVKRQGNQKGGIKIAIRSHKIFIEPWNCIQGLRREICIEDRKELLSLKKHIIKALEWFPPQKCYYYRTIFEHAIKGLEALRRTYGTEEDGTEEDFTSRGIKQYIEIIQKALDDTDFCLEEPPKIATVRDKIAKNVKLEINETIEFFLYQNIKPLWELREDLSLQTLHNNFITKRIDSIRADVRYNPACFKKILKAIPFSQALPGGTQSLPEPF